MENLEINIDKVFDFVPKEMIFGMKETIQEHIVTLYQKTGKGNEFLGWLNLPSSIDPTEIEAIKATAERLKNSVEVLVVIGIGGSYLGTRAVLEALSNPFNYLRKDGSYPKVIFAGQNISEDYLFQLLEYLEDKKYAINVISKSGTTTEPAIAFRFLKEHLEEKVGKEESKNRIVAVTDRHRGALKQLAIEEGYETYVIPDDIGGRYSVLTPVGLLPIAIAGFDIDQIIHGARVMQTLTSYKTDFEENPAAIYAATRNVLYNTGKTTEILVNYIPYLQYFAEWWKQLYGESEGKENKGIFPVSVNFTTDLHSMGQYIQEGLRNNFETIISVNETRHELRIKEEENDLDGLNYLAGKRVNEVNKMAEMGTMMAHIEGGVPNIILKIPRLDTFYLGQMIYFFEKACAISGYTLGVNPFDQPGVEAYKKNMFTLLNKPGYQNKD